MGITCVYINIMLIIVPNIGRVILRIKVDS